MPIFNFHANTYSDSFKEEVTEFANALWTTLSRSETYSFAKDPLPVFYLLHAAYCDYDSLMHYDHYPHFENLSYPQDSLRARLLNLFPENCRNVDWDVFDEFCFLLSTSINDEFYFGYKYRGAAYKYIHPFVVEFFVQKLIDLYKTEYELSENVIDKLWHCINECDEIGNSSHYYISYSGLCSIALHEINSGYSCELRSYYCEEDDPVLSLISKVRLCSLGHNYQIVQTSEDLKKVDMKEKTENIAFISMPPFNKQIKRIDSEGNVSYCDVAEDVIEKFLNDKRFETAYLVFPISFATDSKFATVRKRLVEDKLIRHIVKIPEGSFMTSSTAGIILCLDKSNKSEVIKFDFDDKLFGEISFLDIINNDYSLFPDLYLNCVEQKLEYGIKHSGPIYSIPHHWNPNPQKLIFDDTEIDEELDSENSNSFNSDLMHCLGPVFNRINNIADENMADNSNSSILKLIKDNLGYMSRIIKSFGVNFDNYAISKRETNVNEFFSNFYTSSQNCMNSSFAIEYSSDVDDETTFDIDEDIVRIMLDTILDNAYRHGFKKKRLPDAKLYISTSCVSINQREYVLIEVANNGAPLSEDFTIDKFIARGEHCGESGNTGLGGHHVYNIVKLHNGFLYVTKSAKWSVIFEILIPAEYLGDKDFNNLKEYYNATKCV